MWLMKVSVGVAQKQVGLPPQYYQGLIRLTLAVLVSKVEGYIP